MPYYVIGQLDTSREVLIPTKKWIDGKQVDGYSILNPLYTHEGGRWLGGDWSKRQSDPVYIDRAALIVNRGWIPKELKNPLTRPHDLESSKRLVKMKGCYRPGQDVHDYKIPNSPDDGEWHNFALQDIGRYWELPNVEEAKYYYF